MKKLLMICLAATMFVGVATARETAKKEKSTMVTVVFQTDIECENCKRKVENNIPFEKGVKRIEIDMETQQVEVTYDSRKNSTEGIIEGFRKIKVNAEPLPATEQ